MAGEGIAAQLYLLDEAFDGRGLEESNESQSLIGNLATVQGSDWTSLPPGATRTIEAIARHAGACKIMYGDHAFADGTRQWGTPEVEGPWEPGSAPIEEVIDWLREAHRSFRASVAQLSDEDLDQPRLTNWGESRSTRWLIAAIVGHDFYHAGEINHLRSLLGTDDRWRWQQYMEPLAE